MFGRQWRWRYHQIEDDVLTLDVAGNKEQLEGHHHKISDRKQQLTVRAVSSIGTTVLLVVIIVVVTVTNPLQFGKHHRKWDMHRHSYSKTNDKPHLCGNSSSEAVALGCSFDQLTWAWLPPHCSHYANEDFLNAEPGKPWKYFEDIDGKKQVDEHSWGEVLDGELMIFGERREHLTHCVFLFLSLGQIIRDGTKYIEKMGDYNHIHHCAMLLFDVVKKEREWNDIQTIVGTVSYDQSC